MQRIARAGIRRDVIFRNVFAIGNCFYEFAVLIARRVAPAVRRDLSNCFDTFRGRAHGIFVRADAYRIGIEDAAPASS